ncbi:hypothetical protein [Mycobacterium sp. E740]|uniref:hypothetical protein n=1 Tax=Mycobacterium sp. E740 TaxID=1834149 RepID=UPI0007FD70E1|nr:hypothetical protein [Mycobacterium sp. E740]OBI80241.1 hypothetical protein A5663_17685 [Mycobacterium sp. E740]
MMKKRIAAALLVTPLLFAAPAQADTCDAGCTWTNQVNSLTTAYNATIINLIKQRDSGAITRAEYTSKLAAAKAQFKADIKAANNQLTAALKAQVQTPPTTHAATASEPAPASEPAAPAPANKPDKPAKADKPDKPAKGDSDAGN